MLRTYFAFHFATIVLTLALLTGCAPTATLLVPQPAATPAVGRGRLAVMELDAPEAHRPLAHRAVCERLNKSGLVPVVDGRELQQFAPWPLHHTDGRLKRDAALDAARRMGLESMLVGQVQLLEADGSPYGSKAFRFGNPAVRAVVAYELLDVRSGQVVFDGTAESDEVMLDGDSRSAKSQEKALEQLTVQAAHRLAERLIPHDAATAVKLASPTYGAGTTRLRQGNRAAERGEWAEAVGHWQAAVAENPDSHAALYNLALGYEALRDYGRAEQFASAALEKSNSDRYRETRERIQLAARQLPVVLAQRGAVPGHSPQVAPVVYRLPTTEPQPMPGPPIPAPPGSWNTPGTWTNPADLGCLYYSR